MVSGLKFNRTINSKNSLVKSTFYILQNFADDSDLSANSRSSASTLTQKFISLYEELGLKVNSKKSACISIAKAEKCNEDLVINSATQLSCFSRVETIGNNSWNKIIVDEVKILQILRIQIERMVSTQLFIADQKFNVLSDLHLPNGDFSITTSAFIEVIA